MRRHPPFALTPVALSVAVAFAAPAALAADISLDGTTQSYTTSTTVTDKFHIGDGAGAIDVGADQTVDLVNTIDGTGSGSDQFIKLGSGTLNLTVDNQNLPGGQPAYAGGTIIASGTLGIISDTNLGKAGTGLQIDGGTLRTNQAVSSARDIELGASNGTIDTAGSNSLLSGNITGNGALIKNGNGVLTITGNNTYTGGTQINNGVLAINKDAALGTGNTVTLSNSTLQLTSDMNLNRTLSLTSGALDTGTHNVTLNGTVSGSTLTKTGTGVLTLTQASTLSGSVVVRGGTVKVADDNFLGVQDKIVNGSLVAGSFVALDGGSLQGTQTLASSRNYTLRAGGGTINVSHTDAGNVFTLKGIVSGTGALTKTGDGVLVLDNQTGATTQASINTYSGNTLVQGGILQFDSMQKLGTGTQIILAGGDLHATGAVIVDRALVLQGTGGAFDTDANLSTISGAISGDGRFSKEGIGTLVLSGTNTYTGGTLLQEGNLQISSDSNLGDASSVLTMDGGVLQLTADTTIARKVALNLDGTVDSLATNSTISGVISGNGGLIKEGTGTLTLSGTNTYTGETIVRNGTLQIASDQNLAGTSALKLDGGALQLSASTNLARNISLTSSRGTVTAVAGTSSTLSGVVSGTGQLVKSGSGTLDLASNNTYTGGTLVSGGLLGISTDANLGSGLLTLNGGSLRANADGLAVTHNVVLSGVGGGVDTAGHSARIDSVIAGTGAFIKSGTGTLTLNGTNTYTGGTVINAGNVAITDTRNLGDLASGVTLNGGNLQTDADLVINRALSVGTANGGINTAGHNDTLSGIVSGAGTFIKSGAGTLTLTADNTQAGGVSVTGGVLAISKDSNLGATNGGLTLDGGTLRTTADVTSARAVTLGSNNATIDTQGNTLTLNGVVSGTGRLSQSGFGTLVLNGNNTYTGNTSVNTGKLVVGNSNALGAAANTLSLTAATLSTAADVKLAQNVVLSSGTTIDTQNHASELAGVVSGDGGFVKAGSGNLTLSGKNTFNGDVAVTAGTLTVAHSNALGEAANTLNLATGTTLATSANVTLAQNLQLNGTVNLDSLANSSELAGILSGAGTLNKNGTGTLKLSGDNAYNGTVQVNAGTLAVASNNALGSAGNTLVLNGTTLATTADVRLLQAINLVGGGTVSSQSASSELAGVISGAGGLTKSGSGNLTLTGTNTYAGGTTINAGTLSISAATNLGSGTITLNGGSLLTLANMDITQQLNIGASSGGINTAGHDSRVSSVITGANGFVKSGAGKLTLTGANTYTGGTTVNGGTLVIGSDGNLGAAGTSLTLDGGTLQVAADVASARALVLGAGNGVLDTQAQTLALSGTVSGAGSLTKVGSGTLQLTGTNTYTGGTNLTAGTLSISSDASLGATASALTMSNGTTLQTTQVVNSSRAITLGGAVTIDTQANNDTFAGVLSGAGTLQKSGTGMLTLSGNNTYSGGTVVNAGTLRVSSDSNLGDAVGMLSLADNTTLQTAADLNSARGISLTGNVTVDTLDKSDTLSGIISGTGSLTKTGTGTLSLQGVNSYSGGTVVNAGTLAVASDASLGDVAGTLALNNAVLQTTSNVDSARAVTVTGAVTVDTQANTSSLTGVVSGTGSLTKSGSGLLTLSGNNTYSGGTSVTGGTLAIASNANLGDTTGMLSLSNATLRTTAAVNSTRNLALAGTATVDTQANNDTLSGVISGTGALVKTGFGTLALTGTNTYSGGTTVNAGTLSINSDASLGAASGALALNAATLRTTANVSSSRTVALTGTAVIDTATNADTLSGVISGSGKLLKTGAGLLTLSGSNTYSGGTDLSEGTLVVANAQALGTGAVALQDQTQLLVQTDLGLAQAVSANGLVTVDVTGTTSVDGVFSGNGTFNKQGSGLLALNNANTYSGVINIKQGALSANNAAALGASTNTLHIDTGAELRLAANFTVAQAVDIAGVASVNTQSNNNTLSGVVSGAGTLTKTGSGTLVLTGNNTYTGGTVVMGGVLNVQRDANLGAAGTNLALNAGTLLTSADFTSDRNISLISSGIIDTVDHADVLRGVISGTGNLVKTGTGNLQLTGTNTYTGTTTVSAGTLEIANDSNLGVGGLLNLNGGKLLVDQALTTSRAINVGSAGGVLQSDQNLRLDGVLSGNGVLDHTGSGSLTLTGTNTLTGTLRAFGNTLSISSGSNLGANNASLMLSNAVLQVSADTSIAQNVLVDAAGARIDTANTVQASGVISGSGVLTKTGTGTLTLSGNNTYTGNTVINGGTVAVSNNANLGATGSRVIAQQGTLTLASGFTGSRTLQKTGSGLFVVNGTGTLGTLQVDAGELRVNGVIGGTTTVSSAGTLRGTGTLNGNVTVAGTLSPGNSPGVLTVTGNVTQQAGSTLALEIDGATAGNGAGKYSQLLVGGTYTANGTLAPQLTGMAAPANNNFVPTLGQGFAVVKAGSVQGAFTGVAQPAGLPTGTRFDVLYAPTSVSLYVTPRSYANLTPFGGYASANRSAVGAILDRNRPVAGTLLSGDVAKLYNGLMPMNAAALGSAFDSLSATAYAEAMEAVLSSSYARARSVLDLAGDEHDRVSVKLLHSNADVDSDGNGLESNRKRNGVQISLLGDNGEEHWSPLVGLNFANTKLKMPSASAGLESAELTLGTHMFRGDLHVLLQGNFSTYNLDVKRDFGLSGTSYATTAKAGNNKAMGLGVDIAYNAASTLLLGAGLRADRVQQKAITEDTSSPLGLTVAAQTKNRASIHAGFQWSTLLDTDTWKLRPSLQVEAEHFLSHAPTTVQAGLLGQSLSNTATDTGANALHAAAGLAVVLDDDASIGLSLTSEKRSKLSSNGIELTLNRRF